MVYSLLRTVFAQFDFLALVRLLADTVIQDVLRYRQ